MSFRHAKASGVVTMISMGTEKQCNATLISMPFSRTSPTTGMTISKSTSLSGPASPRACEPNRMTCSGSNCLTIRLTMRSMIAFIFGCFLARGMGSPEKMRFVGNPFYPGGSVVAMVVGKGLWLNDRGRLPLGRRLQGPAMVVVEGVVQEENVGDFHTQAVKLPAQLLEGVRPEPARHQGADMFGA